MTARREFPRRIATVQAEALALLLLGGTLTVLGSVRLCGTSRIPVAVAALRHRYGWAVLTELEQVETCDGRAPRVARYRLATGDIHQAGPAGAAWARRVARARERVRADVRGARLARAAPPGAAQRSLFEGDDAPA